MISGITKLLKGSSPYALLGVEPNASQQEIRHAYLNILREYLRTRNSGGARLIRQAYKQLQLKQESSTNSLFVINDSDVDVDMSIILSDVKKITKITADDIYKDIDEILSIKTID